MDKAKEFEEWLRAKHLKTCVQCQKEGTARLIDANQYALQLVREFYANKSD